jgi:formate dehydrogenase subunit beta
VKLKEFSAGRRGCFFYSTPPVIIDKPEDAEKLVWDDFAINNLAIYLLDKPNKDKKVALFVKGCDSRGIVRMLQDKQIKRENIYLIGIPCPGLKDPKTAVRGYYKDATSVPKAKKCEECRHPNPVLYDEMLGSPVEEPQEKERFAEVNELEKKSVDEKYAYWTAQADKCLRCYACRNVCPACSCPECLFDCTKPSWLDKEVSTEQNQVFHMIRVWHVADRCIECGECERVCPAGLPLMQLNRKLIKDINELFGPFEAGLDLEQRPPLTQYETGDPEEFM